MINKIKNAKPNKKIKSLVKKLKINKNIFIWTFLLLLTAGSSCFLAFTLGAFDKSTYQNTSKYMSINKFEQRLRQASNSTTNDIYFEKVTFDTFGGMLIVDSVDNLKKERLVVPMSTTAMSKYEVNNDKQTKGQFGVSGYSGPYTDLQRSIIKNNIPFEGIITYKVRQSTSDKNNTILIAIASSSLLIPIYLAYREIKKKHKKKVKE